MITLGLIPDWQFSSDPAVNPYAGPPSKPSMGLAGITSVFSTATDATAWLSKNKTPIMVGAGVIAGLAVAAAFLR